MSFNISTEKTSAMVQTCQGSPRESVGTEIHQTHIRREKEDEWSDTEAVNSPGAVLLKNIFDM